MARSRSVAMPSSLHAARAVMFVVGCVVGVVGSRVPGGYGVTAENIGVSVAQLVPGAVSLYLALRIAEGGQRIRTAIIVLQVIWIMIASGRLGQGGCVTDDISLFALYDEPDGIVPWEIDDWLAFSHWLADPTSGRVMGRVTYPEEYPLSSGGDGHTLGDGTWLTTGSDRIYRWRVGG